MKPLINTITKQQVKAVQLNLKNTLLNGQCFNWERLSSDEDCYQGILKNNLVKLYQKEQMIFYEFKGKIEETAVQDLLNEYLNLKVDFQEHVDEWINRDQVFKIHCQHLEGVRILDQDPFECILSFICSQNNNIPRIKMILQRLRTNYGKKYNEEEDEYYQFPQLDDLIDLKISDFQELGLGYRSKYIFDAVQYINDQGGVDKLQQLKKEGKQEEIQTFLLKIKGIGFKVADCIMLFSFNQGGQVPVDTHVQQIYRNLYKQQSKIFKYQEISDFFRNKFGDKAGWAQQWLFMIDLKEFQTQEQQSKKQKQKDKQKQKQQKS